MVRRRRAELEPLRAVRDAAAGEQPICAVLLAPHSGDADAHLAGGGRAGVLPPVLGGAGDGAMAAPAGATHRRVRRDGTVDAEPVFRVMAAAEFRARDAELVRLAAVGGGDGAQARRRAVFGFWATVRADAVGGASAVRVLRDAVEPAVCAVAGLRDAGAGQVAAVRDGSRCGVSAGWDNRVCAGAARVGVGGLQPPSVAADGGGLRGVCAQRAAAVPPDYGVLPDSVRRPARGRVLGRSALRGTRVVGRGVRLAAGADGRASARAGRRSGWASGCLRC
jgi:hypothetical protein